MRIEERQQVNGIESMHCIKALKKPQNELPSKVIRKATRHHLIEVLHEAGIEHTWYVAHSHKGSQLHS